MRIAIVEDNLQAQDRLKTYIELSAQSLETNVTIDIYDNGLAFIDRFDNTYDIIYLDVEMDYMDGMTTAKKVREKDTEVLIVFVTNHAQVAVQGYSVEATDFLLKPLSQFTFHEHFKKIINKIKSQQNLDNTIMLKVSGTLMRINQNTIKYVESQGHYIDFFTLDGQHTIIETMKNVEAKLDTNNFFRCSNSHIVNFNYINKVEKNLVYIDGRIIQISRARKKDFMDRFTRYLGDQII